jgi:alpha 1,6-mannosyltransferase
VYRPPSAETLRSLHPAQYLYSSPTSAQVIQQGQSPLEVLSQLYEDERVALLDGYDQAATEALVRTAPSALDPDFNNYISRLEEFINTYFRYSSFHAPLFDTLQRMVNAHPPLVEQEFAKYVFSFDKAGRFGVPEEFQWWDRRLTPQGWTIEVGDDAQMEEWFERSIGDLDEELNLSQEAIEESGKRAWENMWHGLGKPVLKSDLLRYLMMLVQGGLYTDSDTSVRLLGHSATDRRADRIDSVGS